MKSISLIIPLYNEEPSLVELYREIREFAETVTGRLEFLFVDDGSRDGSYRLLRKLQSRDPRIGVIRLRRNFGKSAALSAGFRLATGEVIVTLDADLQDKPAEIGKLLARLDGGCDLVSGWKNPRRDPWSKRWASKLFNLVTGLITGVPLHDINSGLKAYRREVVDQIRVYGEMHRFIPVLASYRGFVVSEVVVEHRRRRHGRSKFGASRLAGGFFDLLTVVMLTRYNSKPLHVFGILGLTFVLVGVLIEAYLTIGWFSQNYIGDRPLFMLGLLLLIVGIQFIFFGMLAEMIAYSSRREDDYSIKEVSMVEPGPRAQRQEGK